MDWIVRGDLPVFAFGKIEEQQILVRIAFLSDETKKISGNKIIGIDKYNPFAPTMVETFIPGGGYTAIFLMNNADTAVPPGIFFTYGRTVVGGTVIDQNDFEIITGRI